MSALSATYYTAYAHERTREAQATIDRHAVSAYTGCCLACGRLGPCGERLAAEQTLLRYARLPRRRPGATLAPAEGGVAGFAWFTTAEQT
jgi:hypothetical protein